jgi:hypothetical protein
MAISSGLGVGVLVAVGVGVVCVTDVGATVMATAGRGKLAETKTHRAASPTCNKTRSLRLYPAIGGLVTYTRIRYRPSRFNAEINVVTGGKGCD